MTKFHLSKLNRITTVSNMLLGKIGTDTNLTNSVCPYLLSRYFYRCENIPDERACDRILVK